MKDVLTSILEKPAEPIAGKSYVYDQIMDWVLEKKTLDFSRMTNLAKPVRAMLEREYSLNTLRLMDLRRDGDGTAKFLFELQGREPAACIESVFIPSHTHTTGCLSTQTGCACGCVFCATGASGPGRNLHFSEIVLQLLNMESELGARIGHVVFMGMGEPLHNYEQTVAAVRFFQDSRLKIGARRMTVSTIGVPEKIRRLADEQVRAELALSLHSAIESKRRRLIPLPGLATIEETMRACDYHYRKTKRLPTLEYVVIKDVNDGADEIRAMDSLLRNRPYKVNLIALNAAVSGYRSPARKEIEKVLDGLEQSGIRVTIRRSAGRDIEAACGQLRAGRTMELSNRK